MISPTEIRTIEDVIDWLQEAAAVTPFGSVGITIELHDGAISFVKPEWKPQLRVAEKSWKKKQDKKNA